jgi:hypothetical protein
MLDTIEGTDRLTNVWKLALMDQAYKTQGDKVANALSILKEESDAYTRTKKKENRATY